MNKTLKNFFLKFTDKSEINIFPRATVGIYSLFKIINEKKKSIIFPSTICTSPVYASIFANINPIFCDVNLEDGNMNVILLDKILKKNSGKILGIFAANMYGNPCEANKIKELSKKNSVYFIEDCAQSFGTINNKKFTGSFGDISVFSFGYSKNIDVGSGGLLLTKDKILSNEIEKVYKKLNCLKKNNFNLMFEYKKKYFDYIKNKRNKGFLEFICINKFKNLFIFKGNNLWINEIEKKIKKLSYLKKLNFLKYLYYKKNLNNNFKIMNIEDGTFAWRFNLFCNNKIRNKKLELFWKLGGHANILYPSVPNFLYGKRESFFNSSVIDKTIINLPLNESFSNEKLKKNLQLFKKIFLSKID